MFPAEIIAKKRDCQELSADEIRFFVRGLVDGSIPDYQLSAWAMAVLCRGMNDKETAYLTDAMLDSGARLERITDRPRVDKHSTGGLGDKVSLVLAPLLACFDVEVPMFSGRGLGITGGTLDKLESYRGLRCDLSSQQIDRQLRSIGCVITGTTPQIAPADRKLYSLRDVTGTVPSIPLITSSIMSKKLAASLDALVLDVKFGTGAFMRNLDDARGLARSLCATGQRLQLDTRAIISDMNQPLGSMVGNACEVNESVDVLQGNGPADVRELTLRLSSELLIAVDRFPNLLAAKTALAAALDDGRALDKYQQMIELQGGQFVERLELAPSHELAAESGGWIHSMDGQAIGRAVIALGGGRTHIGAAIDHAVGLEMLVRIGDEVRTKQPIARIFASTSATAARARDIMTSAIEIAPQPASPLPLILETPS